MPCRIFCTSEARLASQTLRLFLQNDADYVAAHFHEDPQGWHRCELQRSAEPRQVTLEHYWSSEEGIRAELNTWAAWLEIHAADPDPWMLHMISTRQIFVLALEQDVAWEHALCQFLCRELVGIYQIDGRGFFDAQGKLLAAEPAE